VGRTRGQERSVIVQVGGAFGLDIRPSRLFIWAGPERRAERILPFGRAPRTFLIARRRRHYAAGPVQVTVHGNPLITVGQAGLTMARMMRRSLTAPSGGSVDLPR
jgi:hypothetical protein